MAPAVPAPLGRGRQRRPPRAALRANPAAVLAFVLLAGVSTALVVRATADPPRGTVFAGSFNYLDDYYNYLSYVEQAQRGVLLFKSKLVPPDQPATVLNLEWLAVGWLARLLGGRAILAYRLVALAALGVLVAVAARWLRGCGASPRLAALLLVLTGGGLGGALMAAGLLPATRALDVRTGAFPFVELVTNPHFQVGTALLAVALACFAAGRRWLGAGVGAALALVRPYDAALLVVVEAACLLLHQPRRAWTAGLAPLAPVLAVLAYPAVLLAVSPGFRSFANPAYGEVAASPGDLLIALGPAIALALTATPAWRATEGRSRDHLARLALWAAVATTLAASRAVSFSLQFLVGAGFPLLALGAVGLARLSRPWLAVAAVPAMATTALVVCWMCTRPTPGHVIAERWRIASAMRGACRPGQLVLAPPDIGSYFGGLTACWPYVSHAAAPDYPRRLAEALRFYDASASPESRTRLLEELCVDHVVVPLQLPGGWLADAGFRFSVGVQGRAGGLAVWSRGADRPCATRFFR